MADHAGTMSSMMNSRDSYPLRNPVTQSTAPTTATATTAPTATVPTTTRTDSPHASPPVPATQSERLEDSAERPTSAPPDLELSSRNVFAFGLPGYAGVFANTHQHQKLVYFKPASGCV